MRIISSARKKLRSDKKTNNDNYRYQRVCFNSSRSKFRLQRKIVAVKHSLRVSRIICSSWRRYIRWWLCSVLSAGWKEGNKIKGNTIFPIGLNSELVMVQLENVGFANNSALNKYHFFRPNFDLASFLSSANFMSIRVVSFVAHGERKWTITRSLSPFSQDTHNSRRRTMLPSVLLRAVQLHRFLISSVLPIMCTRGVRIIARATRRAFMIMSRPRVSRGSGSWDQKDRESERNQR